MHLHLALATLLTAHTCASLRQPPRVHGIHRCDVAAPVNVNRRAAVAPLAVLAALAVQPATAIPPPEGCVWTGEGEYPGRKSGQDVKLINANLDCNSNFIKDFGVSELIVTPAILGVAAVIANFRERA